MVKDDPAIALRFRISATLWIECSLASPCWLLPHFLDARAYFKTLKIKLNWSVDSRGVGAYKNHASVIDQSPGAGS